MSLILSQKVQGDSGNFNSVPEFCCALRSFEKKNVREFIGNLGTIFLKHGVSEKYGLVMNHRHFSLFENEILVETLKEDGRVSVAMPWKINGSNAVPPRTMDEWKEHELIPKSYIIPQTWYFSDTGGMTAYEFLSTDELDDEKPPFKFTSEVFQALKSYGVEKILGIRRLDDNRDGDAFEMTPKGKRYSVTTMGSRPTNIDPKNMTKVLWYFTPEGDLKESMDCTRCGTCGICF